VSETVGNLEPGYVDEAELSELLEACGPHVTELRCKQTLTTISLLDELTLQESNALPRDPVHVDFEFVLRRLRNVRRLGIVYGPERIAVDEEYTSHLYKINENDMDTLGRGLESSAHLVSLAVTKSAVDVTMFNRLLPYLKQCHGLKDVDFSFCRLRSPGGKSMARFAKTAAALKLLNLSGNDIGADAVESLAFVSVWRRKNGYPAIELNLSTLPSLRKRVFHSRVYIFRPYCRYTIRMSSVTLYARDSRRISECPRWFDQFWGGEVY